MKNDWFEWMYFVSRHEVPLVQTHTFYTTQVQLMRLANLNRRFSSKFASFCISLSQRRQEWKQRARDLTKRSHGAQGKSNDFGHNEDTINTVELAKSLTSELILGRKTAAAQVNFTQKHNINFCSNAVFKNDADVPTSLTADFLQGKWQVQGRCHCE